jgi:Domain of unknown function (DUF4157)
MAAPARAPERPRPPPEPEVVRPEAPAAATSFAARPAFSFSSLPIDPPPPIAPRPLPLLPPTVPVDEPDHPLEAEADRIASLALRALHAALPPPIAPAPVAQRLQRSPAGPEPSAGGGLVVEDNAQSLTEGQMRKTAFLAELRTEACAAADKALERAGRDTRGCPYVERWLAYYAERPAAQLERAVRKFVPGPATSAQEYIPRVSARIAVGVERWVATGSLPDDIPPELVQQLAGGGIGGAIAGAFATLAGAIGGAVSAIGRLLFKDAPGGARAGADRGALVERLGAGRPLDGAARGRMESAFGRSFADVRLHDDARGASLARDLRAHAFTLGSHVAFADGRYRPGTPAGDALLAHELAHVVQQGGGAPAAPVAERAVEDDADRAAAGAVAAIYAPERALVEKKSSIRTGLRLSRCSSAPQIQVKSGQFVPLHEANQLLLADSVIGPWVKGRTLPDTEADTHQHPLSGEAFLNQYMTSFGLKREDAQNQIIGRKIVAFTIGTEVYLHAYKAADYDPDLAGLASEVTPIHEAVHLYGSAAWATRVGFDGNEGATQFFTRRVLKQQKNEGGNPELVKMEVYKDQLAAVDALLDHTDEDKLAGAYFAGTGVLDEKDPIQKLRQSAGEARFDAWAAAMARGNIAGAKRAAS